MGILRDIYGLVKPNHLSLIRGFSKGKLIGHCEEPQATKQSQKMEAGLLRYARNDTKIRESPGELLQGGLFEFGLTD